MRIAVPGSFADPKGKDDAIRIFDYFRDDKMVEFHVLGRIDGSTRDLLEKLKLKNVVLHNGYDQRTLPAMDLGFDVALYLSQWPETYCMAVSEMVALGAIIVGYSIGAPSDRISPDSGILVELGNIGGVIAALVELQNVAVRAKYVENQSKHTGYVTVQKNTEFLFSKLKSGIDREAEFAGDRYTGTYVASGSARDASSRTVEEQIAGAASISGVEMLAGRPSASFTVQALRNRASSCYRREELKLIDAASLLETVNGKQIYASYKRKRDGSVGLDTQESSSVFLSNLNEITGWFVLDKPGMNVDLTLLLIDSGETLIAVPVSVIPRSDLVTAGVCREGQGYGFSAAILGTVTRPLRVIVAFCEESTIAGEWGPISGIEVLRRLDDGFVQCGRLVKMVHVEAASPSEASA